MRLLILVAAVFGLLYLIRQLRRGNTSRNVAAGGAMSRSEALAILGLEEGADRDAIVQAHRQLMQRLHPDRGGNHYLASQLNRAKAFLLEKN